MNKGRVSDSNKAKIIKWSLTQQRKLNLNDWKGRISFKDKLDNPDSWAEIYIDEDYLRFWIEIHEPSCAESIKDKNIDDIKSHITHELVHVIVDPLYRRALEAQTKATRPALQMLREQTVQRITRLLLDS